MTRPFPPLSILQWNARSLYRAKLEEFKANLRVTNPSIVLLSETHWKDQYIPKFTAFHSFVLNRPGPGGGVVILVRKDTHATSLDLPRSTNLETVGVSIRLDDGRVVKVVSVYCPNGSECNRDEITSLFRAVGDCAIVGGDFNAHSPMWEDGHAQNRCGRYLADLLLDENNFALITPKNLGTRPGNPGSSPSTIDLLFATADIAPFATTYLGEYWNSDHLPAFTDINVRSSPLSRATRWNFRKDAWNEWNAAISSDLDLLPPDSPSPEENYHRLSSAIIDASKSFFLPKTPSNPKEAARPWWTSVSERSKIVTGRTTLGVRLD